MVYLDAAGWVQRGDNGYGVVALGGGHGLSATLRALRHITRRLTAVVTVADDGGSSGRLRQEMDVLPPGDLRMALASLCEESEWGLTWRDIMQTRLNTTGPLHGHALGNLLIAGMWQLLDDPVESLDLVGRLLGAAGRVLPMSSVPLHIEADMDDAGRKYTVEGQSQVAVASGSVCHVRLTPKEPPVPSVVIESIEQADWVILGPGSWYTSVIPHLLVPQLHRALVTTNAHRALVLNLARQRGETDRMTTSDHVRVLGQYAPDLKLDVVIADPTTIDDVDDLVAASESLGARLLLRQVRTGDGQPHHDPLRLAAALRDAFDGFLGEVGRAEPWLV
ncbi:MULTISPECIES: gluconeogenesis factor YvcK family protein [unclassified Schaalia]|uniref:gluconeogenesis factor YvcK family protein n=1 Tax=unclassified Schaalia TaxID=2691889 RepID=UPI001E5F6006|nr:MULTISPECIES: uridine diphosphate-N-acetylglucosamine-binding protein YvcK [unclassified Schaalia]MCD4549361.1 uridine diphosphate-N-acetylglucosamine-binding protein YvcK [Schaalia sp. lx-260]MCD4557169.1 uridine diphosphate-N-acetylglucosamine-binding protein YvcK [Schaalia sp. lx-100]